MGDRIQYVSLGPSMSANASWTVKAPFATSSDDTFRVISGARDVNTGMAAAGCASSFACTTVSKAMLSLSARISGPEEALDGSFSVNLPFTVEALVMNKGIAGVDTTGARMEIVLPVNGRYRLNGTGETFRKPYYPGVPVEWNLLASDGPTPPGNITVHLVEPLASDLNTNETAAVDTGVVFIPVETQAGQVTMGNISRLDSIPPYVVPQGAKDVPVLKVALRNNSSFTVGMDSVFVSIKNADGELLEDPGRFADSLTIVSKDGRFSAAVEGSNPVKIHVGHAISMEPGALDTMEIEVDVSTSAPSQDVRFDLAESNDVFFTITVPVGGRGPRVGVVCDENQMDIAGRFFSGPMSVMSSRFDEYVHNYPNPFRAGIEKTKICYFLTSNTSVEIRIFDLAGSLVWTKKMAAGSYGASGDSAKRFWEIEWDGRNSRGEVVRNGVYICRIKAGANSAIFKIAVAK
ncbi:hypothetical protein DRQ05_04080 [bacterium]|nr:MAG: hypothetical protein DRQ05_04080 [bacterium]